MEFNESLARAVLALAGITPRSLYSIANRYWPESYTELRNESPWFIAVLDEGEIIFGWRKRVIEFSWKNTGVKAIVTEDDVTKDEHTVHAYNYAKAVTYMSEFAYQLKNLRSTQQQATLTP